MTDEITIRRIKRDDKPKLLQIMEEFYGSPALLHHTQKDVLSRVIDDCISDMPFLRGYIAVDGAKDIVGYTMLSVGYSTEYGGIGVMIEDLCVVPEARGRGIGAKLIEHVCDTYIGKAVRVRLEVAPSNTRAIALYERCGFTEIEYKQMGKLL